jgi:hypothetical protein
MNKCPKCKKSDEVVTRPDGTKYCLDCGERVAERPSDATACSPRPVFDRDLLTRSILNEKAAEIFRAESKQVILRDPETDARVVCYQHPDGRVLLDAVRLPENKNYPETISR